MRDRGLESVPVPSPLRAGGWMTIATLVILLVLGTITSGAGPHSGDDEIAYRFSVDPFAMARVHAAAVWAFVIVVMVVLNFARKRTAVQRSGQLLLLIALAQGAIGYVQTFSNLPAALVNLHMFGAALLTASAVPFIAATFGRSHPAANGLFDDDAATAADADVEPAAVDHA